MSTKNKLHSHIDESYHLLLCASLPNRCLCWPGILDLHPTPTGKRWKVAAAAIARGDDPAREDGKGQQGKH